MMSFNCVQKEVKMESACNLNQQKVIKEKQGDKDYWERNKSSNYLVHLGENISIKTVE